MTPQEIKEKIAEQNPEALFFDGPEYDEALIGYAERCGQPTLAVYDEELCIQCLMKQGMDCVGAQEFFDLNTKGAWMGEQTPIVFTRLKDVDEFGC